MNFHKKGLLMFMSLGCICFGSLILIFKDDIFSVILNAQLTIKEGTASYNAWVETPLPVYTKFYFFDMLNPRDLFHKHEKPILEERGPYTFRETQKKVDIQWHPNGTVTYKRVKYWYFERDLSVGDLSDVITTINVPVVGSAEFVRGSFFMEWGVSDMLSTIEATIFIKKTIRELLFEGYEDTVMEIGSSMSDYEFEEVEEKNDDKQRTDKFGWFYNRNGTSWSDGTLEMFTGENDINKLGKIASWQGSNRTEAYEGQCGKVYGSADGLFPPGLAAISDSLSLFSTDLCRPIQFTKSGEQILHGIPVSTFNLDSKIFANSTDCPENECYQNNVPSGVLNVTQCKMKSPAFVSRPHFLHADHSYLQQFQYGINPDHTKHDSSFWLEPKSSIPVKVNMRLQLNILLRKVEGIEYLFKNLQEVMYPVFWFESISELPEHMAGPLKMLIMLPNIFTGCGAFSLVSSSLVLFLLIVFTNNENKMKSFKAKNKEVVSIIKEYSSVPTCERVDQNRKQEV